MAKITVDKEFKALIPPLSDDERSRLEKSILDEGVREPIVTWNGVIVDGHNRNEICEEHGIECPSVERDFPSRDAVKIWIIENQLGRRNLDTYPRSVLVLKLEPLYAAEAKRRQKEHGGTAPGRPKTLLQNFEKVNEQIHTDKKLAELAGVSSETMRKVKAIEEEAAKGNEKAIKVREQLMSGEKKSIHGGFIEVKGNPKPRKKEEATAEDGRKICVMCGEPINPEDAHASRPIVHKECEQEYQRDWVNSKRHADGDLLDNVAVYTSESLFDELEAAAANMRDSWMQSIEINEGMGVSLAVDVKKQLEEIASRPLAAVMAIRGKE